MTSQELPKPIGAGSPLSGLRSRLQRTAPATWLNALLVIGFLILYLDTLAPDVLPADNGEFQLVAATVGLAHPPGFPLHTLLGAAMARLPLGTIAWRVNLLSAVLAAGTLGLISGTVRRLTGRATAGFAAALALGTSTTFWAQATVSNVRTLAAFLTGACVYTLSRHSAPVGRRREGALLFFVAALVLGVTHHGSLAFIGLFMVLYLLLIDRDLIRQPRRWPGPVLVVILSLLPLVYLPLRAPDLLATPGGFLHYALARGFSGDLFYFVAPADLLARLRVMGNVLTFQFHPLVLLGGAIGAFLLFWKDRRLALMLVGGFAAHTLVTATYRAPQTVEYMLPAYVLFAVILGYGVAGIAKRSSLMAAWIHPVLLVLVLVAGLAQAIHNYPSYRTLAKSHDAREYARPILAGAPQGAIVLADWHWFTPLKYLQVVEGSRPDLTVEYVSPTAEPYQETWARRIREELPRRPVVVTHYDELAYADIRAILEPLGEAFWVRTEARTTRPDGFTPTHLVLGSALLVDGFQPADLPARPDRPLAVTVSWSPLTDVTAPVTLFVHLVGSDGTLVAQQDVVLDTRWLAPGDLALTRFQLESRPGVLPGQHDLMIGAYGPDGPLSGPAGATRVSLQSIALDATQTPPLTRRPRQQRIGNGFALVGVDWDLTLPDQPRLYLHWRARRPATATDYRLEGDGMVQYSGHLPALPAGRYLTTAHTMAEVPDRLVLVPETVLRKTIRLPLPDESEQYVPLGDGIIYLGQSRSAAARFPRGSSCRLLLHFVASRPIQRDYVVSTSLIGLDPDQRWTWRELDDGVPAMGAIPTLKWIAGSRVTDPHLLTIPPQAPAGRIIGTLALYDAFTGRRLPVLDDRLAAAAPWVPLGDWTLR